MNSLFLGFIIIALGTLIQSCRYLPINIIQDWSWESFSFVQGIFSLLLLPLWGATLAIPDGYLFYELYSDVPFEQIVLTIVCGMIWWAGTIVSENSLVYLGASWGKTLSNALAATLGTLFAAIAFITLLHHTHPTWELTPTVIIGIVVAWIGFILIGFAGDKKNRETAALMDGDRRQFNLRKGILFAIIGGLMAGFLGVGLAVGDGIFLTETDPSFRYLPTIFLICIGAFIVNTVYCMRQNAVNGTFSDYSQSNTWRINIFICVLTGVMEYAALFTLSIGKNLFNTNPSLNLFAYFIMIATSLIFTHLWELIMQEWRGCSYRTLKTLLIGLLILLIGALTPILLVQNL